MDALVWIIIYGVVAVEAIVLIALAWGVLKMAKALSKLYKK